jgi:metal-responsive CopG/Arc/MetJ family transcriptional regulator
MRESVSISLPESIKAELDHFSEAQGISRSDTVRAALQEYLFIRKFRALRAQIVPLAEAQGIFTDEDVFRLVS